MSGSVHISGDGNRMPLRQIRHFVEATKNWPGETWVEAGVVGKHLLTEYSTLQGLRAVLPAGSLVGNEQPGDGPTHSDYPPDNGALQ